MSETANLIDAIGRTRLCDALGVKPGAVSAAAVAGIMPASWFKVVRILADADKLDAPDRLFNWKRSKTFNEPGQET